MKITAKIIGIRKYEFPDSNDKTKTLCGQNVFVSYTYDHVIGQQVDTFKNFESKTKVRIPDLEIGKEYKFILSTDKNNAKSIEMIYDTKGNEIPMIEVSNHHADYDELPFD